MWAIITMTWFRSQAWLQECWGVRMCYLSGLRRTRAADGALTLTENIQLCWQLLESRRSFIFTVHLRCAYDRAETSCSKRFEWNLSPKVDIAPWEQADPFACARFSVNELENLSLLTKNSLYEKVRSYYVSRQHRNMRPYRKTNWDAAGETQRPDTPFFFFLDFFRTTDFDRHL